MKYIVGHTRKEYLVEGTLIPRNRYTEEECTRGRVSVLTLPDEKWEVLSKNAFIMELVNGNIIEVLDKAPADKFVVTSELQQALNQSEERRVALERELDALKKESITTIQELEKELKRKKGP